jgi:hypothetical protein
MQAPEGKSRAQQMPAAQCAAIRPRPTERPWLAFENSSLDQKSLRDALDAKRELVQAEVELMGALRDLLQAS